MNMSNTTQDANSSDDYTQEQMKQILAELQEIAERLKHIDKVLTEEQKKSSEPEDNVVYIVPHVINDFKEIEGKPSKLDKLVTLYMHWTEALYLAVMLNKGHLQNKSLLKHIEHGYKVCKSLSRALEKNNNNEPTS